MLISASKNDDLAKVSNNIVLKNRGEDYQYCLSAYALRITNNFEASIELYKKALKINKNNIEALKGISCCYKSLKQYDLAVKYLNNVKLLTPFERTVHYDIGIIEYENQNYINALKCFINAIKLSPEYYDAIYALGQTHEAIEEYEMAEMIYLKIIENRPSYLMAYNRLANMYLEIEEYKKSIQYFREILSINPEFYRAYFGIAIAFDRSEQKTEARRYYKKYLELKPFSAEKTFITERLQALRPHKTIDEEKKKIFSIVR